MRPHPERVGAPQAFMAQGKTSGTYCATSATALLPRPGSASVVAPNCGATVWAIAPSAMAIAPAAAIAVAGRPMTESAGTCALAQRASASAVRSATICFIPQIY